MPVCIAGMHRSGTSLLARLLHQSGLHIGPDADILPASSSNPEGHWENVRFLALNDAVLARAGAAWDRGDALVDDWHRSADFEPLRAQAADLLETFKDREPWGWKNPRNSLTLPFWLSLLPDLTVIVCVRHPLEVSASLHARNAMPIAQGLRLWASYYAHLRRTLGPGRRLVTHYESLLSDPGVELSRVLEFAGLPRSRDVIESLTRVPKASLRQNVLAFDKLAEPTVPDGIIRDYVAWCAQAGELSLRRLQGELFPTREASADMAGFLGAVTAELIDQRRAPTALAAKSAEQAERIRQLTAILHQAAIQAEKLRARNAVVEDRLTWRRHRWADRIAALYQRGRRWLKRAG